MRPIHLLAIVIVLTMCTGLVRAEYDSGGGASVAKPATQANKQVQPNALRELALGRFIDVGRLVIISTDELPDLIVIRPIGPVPAMRPVKMPMRKKISVPNPPVR